MGKRELPKGWTFEKFEDYVEILDRKRKPVSKAERAKRPGNIPYYGATGNAGSIDDFLFDEELVLLGEDGADFINKDKDVAYLISGKSWVNNHAHVLKGINGLSNKWLCYYLNSINYSNRVGGATRLKLNQGDMKKIPILKIPKTEQQKIVDYLDDKFESIDNIEKEVEEYGNKLDELEKGILKDVFENIEGEEKELGELFDITSSKRIYKSDYVEKGVPFYRSKEIIEKSKGKTISMNYFIDENKFNEIDKGFGSPKEGDILITAVGTIGVTYIVKNEKFYFKDGNLIWLKNKNLVFQKFIDFYLNSYIFTDFALGSKGGAVYGALTIEKLKKFKIKYPDINTQKGIAYKLDKQFELIKSTRNELKNQEENLKNLRKGILNDMFGGFED